MWVLIFSLYLVHSKNVQNKETFQKSRRPRGSDFILQDVEVEDDDVEEETFSDDEGEFLGRAVRFYF